MPDFNNNPDVDLTSQQVFDKCVADLAAMPRQAQEAGAGCRYRMTDGNACIVGRQMTDEEISVYRPDGYGGVESLCRKGHIPPRLRPHRRLLKRFQDIHDVKIYWHHEVDGPIDRVMASIQLYNIAADLNLDPSAIARHMIETPTSDRP